MDYLKTYREMISYRGLTTHTVKSYTTYISAYLDFLQSVLRKTPKQADWDDMRSFLVFIQESRHLSDRTVNAAISQLRFFCIYVLHRRWEPARLPFRKFDSYLPYVPSQEETFEFISTIPDIKQRAMCAVMYSSGLRIGELCSLRYEDIDRKNRRIHVCRSKNRQDRYAALSEYALDLLTRYWFQCGRPMGYLFPQQRHPDRPIDTFYLSRTDPSILFIFHGGSQNTRRNWAGRTASPVTLSATPWEHISMKAALTFLPSRPFLDISP